jgi:hypothetical protein
MAEAATSRDPAREAPPLSMDRLVAQMCGAHGYPALAPQIVTGEISAPVFWMLARQFSATLAFGVMQQMRAVMVGAALAWTGEKAQPMADRIIREAYPRGEPAARA